MDINNDNEIARARKAKRRRVRRRRAALFLLALAMIMAIVAGVSMYSTVMSYDIRDFFKFLTRTPRGRCVTPAAYNHLGIKFQGGSDNNQTSLY